MEKGMIFNIQKYSIHDGPGIRTTVFLKGCPLNCWWCHNPESIPFKSQIIFRQEKCLGCKSCEQSCSEQVIEFKEGSFRREEERCNLCGRCEKFCPTGAIELIGKEMNLVQVMKEIEKDRIFYDESKGGVTFSGGEPLMQHEFLNSLLTECRRRGIRTAVDTTGYVSWSVLEEVAKGTDLFLYDLKHMEEEKHQLFTGVSNQLILSNLKRLANIHKNINIRIPVIPGVNDEEENILKIGEFISSLDIQNVNILPYHNIGLDKYAQLGEVYKMDHTLPPSEERMMQITEKIKSFGLNVKIGG